MMLLQLNPSIPMQTVKGMGEAILVIDYGPEFDLMFVVAMDEGGAVWTLRNKDVRLVKNESLGRSADPSFTVTKPLRPTSGSTTGGTP